MITIILIMGIVILWKGRPFWGGFLGAATLYILLRNQMIYLTEKKRLKRGIMSVLLLLETLLFFLIPLGLLIWLLISKFDAFNLDPHSLLAPLQQVAEVIEQKTGYDILSKTNLNDLIGIIPKMGQLLIGSISSIVINMLVLLLVLYFMFIGGRRMENYIASVLPFNRKNKEDLLHEFYMVVKSNAIGVPLLAIVQGGAAMLGYYLFGVPEVLLWGVLSCFATIIPVIGVGLVWIPICLYLGVTGGWGYAIGLAAYSLVVVGNIDNLFRSLLQKKMSDTHPLITIFGVLIGLAAFGLMGVIFGPLLLAIFVLCVKIFRQEYLEDRFPPEEHPIITGT